MTLCSTFDARAGDYQPEATDDDISRLRSGSLLPIPEPLGTPLLTEEPDTPRTRKILFFARCWSAKAAPARDAPTEPEDG